MTKDILVKKAFAVGTPTAGPALQFLWVKKRKYVYITGLTSYYPRITIFAIKKVKMAKNILDKKAFAAGTPATAPALWFLQAKKRKHIHITSLTSYCFRITIFAIKKAKIARNILDK